MSKKSDAFMQGYACAVATLQRLDGGKLLTSEVKELMVSGGLSSREAAAEDGVDEYDLSVLFPMTEDTHAP